MENLSHSNVRPLPCPQCESTKGYIRSGEFRVHCLNCNSLLRNEDVQITEADPDKEQS